MLKHACLLLLLLAIGHALPAQSTAFEWAAGVNGSGNGVGSTVVVDQNGNVYTGGSFTNTMDFDPGASTFPLTSAGLQDAYLVKLDFNGQFLNAVRIGGTGNDAIHQIASDAVGNIYCVGFFSGTSDFDPGAGVYNLTSLGGLDVFLLKLDANLNFVWARRWGGSSSSSDSGYGVHVDASGNTVTTGIFSGTVDFDPGAGVYNLSSMGIFTDIFIQKLDPAGNFIWARRIGAGDVDQGNSVTADVAGNIYVTGLFRGTCDFDPGPGTYNLTSAVFAIYTDAFVLKLTPAGNFIWAVRMGDLNNDYGKAVEVDPLGNVICTGAFVDTVDFDPGPGSDWRISNGSEDIFMQKLDSSGSLMWVNTFGGLQNDIGIAMAHDTSGNLYLVGDFRGTVDFDPGPGTDNLTSNGSVDFVVQKSDPAGNAIWTRGIGSATDEQALRIKIGPSGAIHIAGWHSSVTDFDPTPSQHFLTPLSGANGFTVKWSSCAMTDSAIAVVTCNSYTSPSGHHTWTTSGNYLDTIPNAAGCDSVLQIALTVEAAPTAPIDINGPPTICPGSIHTYGVLPILGATSYTWTLPAGWSGTSNSDSIVAIASGSGGAITVTANNQCGTSAATTLNVTVVPSPIAAFSSTPNYLVVNFTDQTTGTPNDWHWDFGDGANSILQNPSHTYAGAGTYQVCLIASNAGCADTVCQPITVVAVGLETSNGILVSAFPNPSSGSFRLTSDRQLYGRLINAKGQTVLELSLQTGWNEIDLSGQSAGVYCVVVGDGERHSCLRLVKTTK